MIRHLHPTDSPGLLQFSQSSGQGETCTLVGALRGGPGGFPAVKYAGIALSPHAWQSCWLDARRGRINGVMRAGPRSGPQAWEVEELFLRNSKPDLAMELLEQIAIPAGGAGAHRIFIRVPANSSVADQAQNAGYSAIYRETVFGSDSVTDAIGKLGITDHSLKLRPRETSDDQSLFRLYNSTTPVEIRMKSGQTIQDWISGSERLGRRKSEWVLELENGEKGGLIQRNTTRSGHMFSLNWASEAGSELPGLVAAALANSREGKVTTAVAEFRPALSHFLVTIGFTAMAQYELMVKPLAKTVAETSQAFAPIG